MAQALTITSTSLAAGTVSLQYSDTLTATGPSTAKKWEVISGSLPAGLKLDSDSGEIKGKPDVAGTSNFKVRVSTTVARVTMTNEKDFSITVNPPLAVGTSALPDASVGQAYSQVLNAIGGTPPLSWSIASGSLPAGLALNGATISGTPSTVGTSTFTVRVSDRTVPVAQTTQRPLSIVVNLAPVQITTTSLPATTVGKTYSQALIAVGGTPPYNWSVVSGTLPAGFALTSAGTLQGAGSTVGSSSIRIRVIDSKGISDTRDFTFIVNPLDVSPSLSGLPGTVNPAQQLPFALSVSAPTPMAVTGTLTVAFFPAAVVPADDPAVQFSTGGRTVNFTIPANSTSAVFPAQTRLMTGTVAGMITITCKIQNGPSEVSVASVSVASAAPQITSVAASRVTGGLRLQIIGFSAERRMTEVQYAFDVRTANGNQVISLTNGVEAQFNEWYRSAASSAFGSAFRFEQLFGVTGDTGVIEAVTITLKNERGSTLSSRVLIPRN